MIRVTKYAVLILAVVACAGSRRVSAQGGDLIAPGAKVEKLAGDFQFTEGPAANAKGDVHFTDIPRARIMVWTIEGKLETYTETSGGANGLTFDRDGRLLGCVRNPASVSVMERGAAPKPLVDNFEGKPFNQPNDLWIDPKGGIYFTDPFYGPQGQTLPQGGMHVYYIKPGSSSAIRVTSDLTRPNGIIGTLDGKTLYVADEGGRKIYVYAINADATLAGKREFADQGSDGITLDERGNLYVTSSAVNVYSPKGEKIMDIAVPEVPANVGFGGADRKTLFITARTSLYSIRMNVTGQ